jgi:hypothetical protein
VQKGFGESFINSFRGKFLNIELFATVAEAQGLGLTARTIQNITRNTRKLVFSHL